MLRDGRLSEGFNAVFKKVNSSLGFDQVMWAEDIAGSKAYAKGLARANIISGSELADIVSGLEAIASEIESGKFQFKNELEDIHMNVESRLIELFPEAGAKLHTGRSRNEQVALDVRMFLKKSITEIQAGLKSFVGCIVKIANAHRQTLMPAYTHLQPAQVITLAHHLLAYATMLKRDHERLADCFIRVDVMPLGSGACAGSGFELDREFLAGELGFAKVSENSLDAVSDRDFILEFMSDAAILMNHLSRFCEDIIFWSSAECGYVTLSDSVSSTSSMMPQKRNPDAVELVRGKSGGVTGGLMALLTTMKGLPLSYNKDMQEDKKPMFETIETVLDCLALMTETVKTASFDIEKLKKSATRPGAYMEATDVADYMTMKGVPFRTAHSLTAKIVEHASNKGCGLAELGLEELKSFCPEIEADIFDVMVPENAVRRRSIPGGTGFAAVERQLVSMKDWLAK